MSRVALLLGLMAIALALPFLIGEYKVHILTISFYYVALAASWNLLTGYTGQFSLAHVAFAGMGAYTSALLVNNFHIPIWLGIIAGGIGAFLLGLILGGLCLRMKGIYLGVSTWAFGETFRILLSMLYKITRGDLGLPTPRLLGTAAPQPYYYVFLGLASATILLIFLIMRSRIGYYLRAIRDDELVAKVMGVPTVRWKIFAFTVSSTFAGVAGAFYGHYIGLLSPAMTQWYEMVTVIIMVVVGGLRSQAGPVMGAILIQVLSELLRGVGPYRMVIFSLAVIVIMRVYNEGLMGLLRGLKRWLRSKGGVRGLIYGLSRAKGS